jgi:hypothetical protein
LWSLSRKFYCQLLLLEYTTAVIVLPNSAKRVAIRIQGGLGNQMFQVALGMALAKSFQVEIDYIRINEPYLKRRKNTSRRIEVRNFLATQNLPIYQFRSFISPISFSDCLHELYPGVSHGKIIEKYSELSYFLNHGDEIVALDGYWQSLDFFRNAQFEVFETFKSLVGVNREFNHLEKLISQNRFIGIHVRRGDYVANSKATKFHGVCSVKYFHSALEHIRKMGNSSSVIIFSDDPAWATNNLGGSNRVIVSGNYHLSDLEELILLSQCSHLILSNSSYSWWAAYLRENRDMEKPVVVAPTPWFSNYRIPSPRKSNWLTLSIDSGEYVDCIS